MKYLQQCKNFIFIWLISSVGLMAQSPVANFSFSGNTRDAVSGSDAKVNGVSLTQDRFGNSGSALNFDGSQSSFSMPSSAELNTDNVTVSFWAKATSIPAQGEAYLISFGGWQERYKVSFPNHGKPVWTTNSTSGISDLDAGDGNTLVAGTWQHWVFVHDGAKDIIYLNGVEANVKSVSGNLNNTNARMGLGYNPIDGGNYYDGALDEVKIYDGALSGQQVADLYASEKTEVALPNGIVAEYKMDGNANDNSGNHNTGKATDVSAQTDRFGYGKSALSFNGTSSKVTVPNSNVLNSDYATIAFWVKPTALPVTGEAFLVSNGGWQSRMKISVPDHGKVVFTTNSTSGISDMDAGGGNEIAAGTWWHVVAVHDGVNDKIFINGLLANSKAITGTLNATTMPLGLGYDAIDNGGFFNGSLDEVKIYNYALSDTEIADLYNSENTFNGSNDDIAADYSLNGNGVDASQFENEAEGSATATTNRFGWANNAALFNGTDSLTAANSTQLNSDFATYSFWINMTALPVTGEDFILSNGGWQSRMKISVPGHGKVVFTTNSTSGISDMDAGGGNELVAGTWAHVVAVHDGTNDIIYINGAVANTKAVSGALNGTGMPLGIGWNPIDKANYLHGSLDDVLVYNRALSASEVADLYNAQKVAPVVIGPLVANYTFAGNANDVTEYHNDANVSGAQLSNDRFDKANKAYNFDGISASITAENSPQQNSDFTTISFWVNVHNLPASGEAFILSNGGWQERWKISLPGHGKPVFTTNNSSGISDMDSGGDNALEVGNWTHVVMTHDGTDDKIYFDGVEVASKAVAGTLNSTTRPLGIGWNPIDNGNYFDGDLDEIRIYNVALSAAEVAALYAEQSTPEVNADTEAPTSPLDLEASVLYTSIDLSWSPSTDNVAVTGYNVYVDGSKVATTEDLNYALNALTPLTEFELGVSAVDAAGNESSISTLKATSGEDETPDTTPPTAPGNLDGTVGANSVLLSWDASTDDRAVKGYVVSVDGTVFDTLAPAATSVLVDGLDPETLYSFEIYAFDNAGNNSEISELTISTSKEIDAGEPGLVAYYPFEGNANDVTPYANNGVIGGNPVFEAAGHANGGAQALKFDGVQDSVLAPNAVQLISDFATIGFWVRVDDVTPGLAEAYILDFGHWSQRWKISIPQHTRIVFTTNSKTTQIPNYIVDMDSKDGNELVKGFWWHVVMTHDGLENKIYINGELANTVSAPGKLNSTNLPLCMGSNPVEGGQYFTGALDELKLYNKALTAQEALDLYQIGTTGTEDINKDITAFVESVFPNPSSDKITVKHNFSNVKPMLIRIMDVQGRQVGAIRYGAGELPLNRFSINVKDYSAGSYYMNFVSEEQSLGSVKFQVK